MRVVYLLGLVGLLAVPASAQTHPCDVTPAVNPSIATTTVWFGLCFPLVDTAGTVVVFTSFRVTVDGVTVFSGPLNQVGGTSASGWVYFPTPAIPIARGSHTAVTYASDVNSESVGSDPYPFSVTKPSPRKGRIQQVSK